MSSVHAQHVDVKASQEDMAIMAMINQIWDKYDKDNSGSLDKEETKQFVIDTMMEEGEFDQESFEQMFIEFDTDKSGTVEKEEIIAFIKNMLHATC